MTTSRRPVAFITGGGTGIGAATAARFSKEGWDVVLVGRRLEPLRLTQSGLAEAARDSKVDIFPTDLADPKSEIAISQWLSKNPDIAQRITAVVHNAGIFERASTEDSSLESWHRIFETNLFGVIRATKALYPFLKQNRGAIVSVSSTLGLRPIPDTPAYSASKAALLNWTASFAKEAAAFGVRVNAVSPGIIDTPIHAFHSAPDKPETLKQMAGLQPLGRVGKPSDVAHMVWSLAGPGSEWITGANVCVDGGINL